MTAVSTPVRISPASIYDSPVCLMNDGANNEFSTPVMDHASLADSLPIVFPLDQQGWHCGHEEHLTAYSMAN